MFQLNCYRVDLFTKALFVFSSIIYMFQLLFTLRCCIVDLFLNSFMLFCNSLCSSHLMRLSPSFSVFMCLSLSGLDPMSLCRCLYLSLTVSSQFHFLFLWTSFFSRLYLSHFLLFVCFFLFLSPFLILFFLSLSLSLSFYKHTSFFHDFLFSVSLFFFLDLSTPRIFFFLHSRPKDIYIMILFFFTGNFFLFVSQHTRLLLLSASRKGCQKETLIGKRANTLDVQDATIPCEHPELANTILAKSLGSNNKFKLFQL